MNDIIQPGDKVLCIKDQFSRPVRDLFTKIPKKKAVYSVRKTATDPSTGKPIVYLVGIYGCPAADFEPAFEAERFKKVSKGDHVMALRPEDMVQVPVRVCQDVASRLIGVALFPMVEARFSLLEDDFEKVCRLWSYKWHQSKTIFEMHQCIQKKIADGDEQVVTVPISGLGLADLSRICAHLKIEPETWLQGVLGNLARRIERMQFTHEGSLRNEEKRRKRDKAIEQHCKEIRKGRRPNDGTDS